MAKTITHSEAAAKLRDFLVALGADPEEVKNVGERFFGSAYLNFSVDGSIGRERWSPARLWATDATVSIMPAVAPSGWRVTVGWSATQRTVAQATAALEVYNRAVLFAARVQALVDELPEIVPDPEPEPAPAEETAS